MIITIIRKMSCYKIWDKGGNIFEKPTFEVVLANEKVMQAIFPF